LGLAACGGSGPSTETAAIASDSPAEAGPAATPAPDAAPPATSPAPEPTTPQTTAAKSTPTTAKWAPTPTSPPTTAAPAAAPPTTAVPETPKFAPGQRINPTSAEVRVAMATLQQRIPLFQPTEPQLRTFADAACASFDQGQTPAQVSSTVRQAVTYVQGASLSTADADFAVRTVVSLRCPGYLT